MEFRIAKVSGVYTATAARAAVKGGRRAAIVRQLSAGEFALFMRAQDAIGHETSRAAR